MARDGVGIGYQDRGVGDPIVFVHEFGGEPARWGHQVAYLKDDYRCITYAARGFFPSDIPDTITLYGQAQATDDLLALIEHLDLDRVHLAGTSMGSFTSLDFTLKFPDRVRSLTLVGNSSGPRDETEREKYRTQWVSEEIRHRERAGSRGAVEILENDLAYASLQRRLPDEWKGYAERLSAQSVTGALNILKTLHWDRRSIWNDEERLRAITCPVLMVHGDEDYFLVGETNVYLEAVLPDATRVLFEQTGHLVNIERADRFNRLMEDHLLRAKNG